MIRINDFLSIPRRELEFSAACAGGPGGQHVNKVATSVTLRFDVAQSPSLSPSQRNRIMTNLKSRINSEGILSLTARDTRSQAANKELVITRFAQLLQQALVVRKHRKATRPSLAAKRRRLDAKRHRAKTKKQRGRVNHDSD